jgi:hypothetical protein
VFDGIGTVYVAGRVNGHSAQGNAPSDISALAVEEIVFAKDYASGVAH